MSYLLSSVLADDAAGKDDLYIRSVCFSPDGKYLATGAEDKQIRVSFASVGLKFALLSLIFFLYLNLMLMHYHLSNDNFRSGRLVARRFAWC